MNPGKVTGAEDAALVARCLAGDEAAWEALLEKYKRLIYSVPLRYRLPPEDAADVFQAVCVDLYRDLAELRQVGALRGWLMRVAAHHSLRAKRKLAQAGQGDAVLEGLTAAGEAGESLLEAERNQMVREAIATLPDRCREMIRMLFFTDPPPSYDEVARRFGIAKGSIGFIRGRCLHRLERALKEAGL